MIRYFSIFGSLALLIFTLACGVENIGNTAYTNKVVAPEMVTKLYGSTSQILSLDYEQDAHITWMGIMQGNDSSYFKITKIESGTKVIAKDGENDFTASSSTIIRDIDVTASASSSTGFDGNVIQTPSEANLKITVSYSPLIGVNSSTDPHKAYLIVYYDKPEVGAVRIELRGYTKGIQAEKCAQAAASLDAVTYNFKDNTFDLYVCGSAVKDAGMVNAEGHGNSANLAKVPMPTGAIMTVYQADESTLCLIASSSSNDTPSIPDFDLPVPQLPGVPVKSLPITMVEGSFAECSLDTDGNIFCDNNLQLDAMNGAVPLSNLSATNGTFTAEDTSTSDCSDFGEISGAGNFNSSDGLTLVVQGEILSGTNSDAYNITGASIIGVINLEPQ